MTTGIISKKNKKVIIENITVKTSDKKTITFRLDDFKELRESRLIPRKYNLEIWNGGTCNGYPTMDSYVVSKAVGDAIWEIINILNK